MKKKVNSCAVGLIALLVFHSTGCSSNDSNSQANTDSQPTGGVIDFEGLVENGFLDGQDNWRDQAGGGQAVVALDVSPANGTRIVQPLLETALNAEVILSRENDQAFTFPAHSPGADGHYIQFDLTAEGIALMALGQDVDGNGILSPSAGETGPRFGIANGSFQLVDSADGQTLQTVLNPGDALSDWYQVRLQLKVDDGDTSPTASVLYRNLSDQDMEFLEVAGLQNIELQLNVNDSVTAPEEWNSVFVQLQSVGGRTPGIDNLIPHGSPTD